MALTDVLGRTTPLVLERIDGRFAYLRLPPPAVHSEPIVVARVELPPGIREGSTVEAFVLQDAQGQWTASFEQPKLQVGEVAFLRVASVVEFGAFVEWGLRKDLLVPSAEQGRALHSGETQPFGLILDRRGRLTGTSHFRKLLDLVPAPFAEGVWVEGEAWRNEPGIGLFVIVAKRWLGLVPAAEPHTQERGQAARYRVSQVLADGKLELSLRGPARDELENDAERILAILQRPNPPKVGDETSPDQVRALFGISKKAFKRALGVLLKRDAIQLDGNGFAVAQRKR